MAVELIVSQFRNSAPLFAFNSKWRGSKKPSLHASLHTRVSLAASAARNERPANTPIDVGGVLLRETLRVATQRNPRKTQRAEAAKAPKAL